MSLIKEKEEQAAYLTEVIVRTHTVQGLLFNLFSIFFLMVLCQTLGINMILSIIYLP